MFLRLLDILADRRNKKGLQGMVFINGEHQPKDFKFMSGYVVQVSHMTSHILTLSVTL